MNEMIKVPTNGSWVTTIMKIRAGRSGARRAQSPARRSAAPPPGAGGVSPAPVRFSTAVLIGAAPFGRRCARLLLVLARDGLGRLLPLVQGRVHGRLTGDRRAHV